MYIAKYQLAHGLYLGMVPIHAQMALPGNTPPPLSPSSPYPLIVATIVVVIVFGGRGAVPRHKVAVVLVLHVVEAAPPHLGVGQRIAVHLEQHCAEEAVPIPRQLPQHQGGGGVVGPQESCKAGKLVVGPVPAIPVHLPIPGVGRKQRAGEAAILGRVGVTPTIVVVVVVVVFIIHSTLLVLAGGMRD
jgi:hypothetical protein